MTEKEIQLIYEIADSVESNPEMFKLYFDALYLTKRCKEKLLVYQNLELFNPEVVKIFLDREKSKYDLPF